MHQALIDRIVSTHFGCLTVESNLLLLISTVPVSRLFH